MKREKSLNKKTKNTVSSSKPKKIQVKEERLTKAELDKILRERIGGHENS